MIPYTCPSSTTTVVIGMTIANTTSSQITVDIKLDAQYKYLSWKEHTYTKGSSFEYMAGNKIILQAGHSIKIQSDTANKCRHLFEYNGDNIRWHIWERHL